MSFNCVAELQHTAKCKIHRSNPSAGMNPLIPVQKTFRQNFPLPCCLKNFRYRRDEG